MDKFVERSALRPPSASLIQGGEDLLTAAKMAPAAAAAAHDPGLCITAGQDARSPSPQQAHLPVQPPLHTTMAIATDPLSMEQSSPAGIAQTVVMLLTPVLAQAVDNAVSKGIEQLHGELQLQSLRISAAEDRISGVEDDTTALSASVARLTSLQKDLQDKVDDLENRSRRNNLRIVGIPESVSASALPSFCSVTIPEMPGFRSPCVVERAHRLGQITDSLSRPRPVIAKYLNYADKQSLLQSFRRDRKLAFEDNPLLLFADYSVEVMHRRKAFAPVCSALFDNHVKFILAYPAILHVHPDTGERLSFSSPQEAEAYLQQSYPSIMEQETSPPHREAPSSGKASHSQSGSPQKPPFKRVRFGPTDRTRPQHRSRSAHPDR